MTPHSRTRLGPPAGWRGCAPGVPFAALSALVRHDKTTMSDQQIARALARRMPVLYINPAVMPVQSPRRPAVTPLWQLISPDLVIFTPRTTPFQARTLVRPIAGRVIGLQYRLLARALHHPPTLALTLGNPALFDAFPGAKHLYWELDDLSAAAALLNVKGEAMQSKRLKLVRRADTTLVVSAQLQADWLRRGVTTEVLPNGCDIEHLAAARSLPRPAEISLPRPIAGFIGQLSARVDIDLLVSVARRGISVLLVGPRQRTLPPEALTDLLALPNVQWVGSVDYSQIPGYLGALDCALIPYADSAFNRASFPLKIFEYLGAGVPVVSTPIPAADSVPPGLLSVAGPEDFAEAVERQISQNDDARTQRRIRFGAANSWDSRIERLLTLAGVSDADLRGVGTPPT